MSQATTPFLAESSSAVAPPIQKTLRTLYLTLFLRGRSARGLQKDKAPKTVSEKLALTLLIYAAIGLLAFTLMKQPVFMLSAYLHSMTFVFLGMFIASSAGEVLFNREESDILLHRPIPPRLLLRAKIRVILEISLWLACAFNLVGFFVGLGAPDGDGRFPFVHLLSTGMMALFCVGSVVLIYQLCLRWFGREWLDGIMTTAQVVLSVGAMLAGQVVPQLLFRVDDLGVSLTDSWWPFLFPPAWFAGVDNLLAGTPNVKSVVGSLLAVGATGFVLWLSYAKLSDDYQTGLQTLGEVKTKSAKSSQGRRFLDRLVDAPPLSWWLRDPVVRSSFLLTTAYLTRDRDIKLRFYPSLAPFLFIPVIFLAQGMRSEGNEFSGFTAAFAYGYMAVVPLMALDMLKYSQNWQAADVFRMVPLEGPARIYLGVRRAVMLFVVIPVMCVLAVSMAFIHGFSDQWLLLIPALMPLPIFALYPHSVGKAIPLSQPAEEARATSRGMTMMGLMVAPMAICGGAIVAKIGGWFWQFVLVEAFVATGIYLWLRARANNARWESLE